MGDDEVYVINRVHSNHEKKIPQSRFRYNTDDQCWYCEDKNRFGSVKYRLKPEELRLVGPPTEDCQRIFIPRVMLDEAHVFAKDLIPAHIRNRRQSRYCSWMDKDGDKLLNWAHKLINLNKIKYDLSKNVRCELLSSRWMNQEHLDQDYRTVSLHQDGCEKLILVYLELVNHEVGTRIAKFQYDSNNKKLMKQNPKDHWTITGLNLQKVLEYRGEIEYDEKDDPIFHARDWSEHTDIAILKQLLARVGFDTPLNIGETYYKVVKQKEENIGGFTVVPNIGVVINDPNMFHGFPRIKATHSKRPIKRVAVRITIGDYGADKSEREGRRYHVVSNVSDAQATQRVKSTVENALREATEADGKLTDEQAKKVTDQATINARQQIAFDRVHPVNIGKLRPSTSIAEMRQRMELAKNVLPLIEELRTEQDYDPGQEQVKIAALLAKKRLTTYDYNSALLLLKITSEAVNRDDSR